MTYCRERHLAQLAEARKLGHTPEARAKRTAALRAVVWTEERKQRFRDAVSTPEARAKKRLSSTIPIEVRFWRYASPEPNSGCWLWVGSCDTRHYGQLRCVNGLRYATHIAMELDGRPRPFPNACARHKCDNPNCVNPDHLEWGTQADNINDAKVRGRMNLTGLALGRGRK